MLLKLFQPEENHCVVFQPLALVDGDNGDGINAFEAIDACTPAAGPLP